MFKITKFPISTGPKPTDLCDKYVKQRPKLTTNFLIVTFYQDFIATNKKARLKAVLVVSLVEGMLSESV